MGPYPMCVLDTEHGLETDLGGLAGEGLVSLVLVTDCLAPPPQSALTSLFDLVRPYKTHHVYDATKPNADYSKHHRDRVRRALKSCDVRVVPLREHLDAWMSCYATLVARRGITGIQNFPRSYFEQIAEMPGFTTVAAFVDGAFASGHIWAHDDGKCYAHLAASTDVGYKLRCQFAIYDHAIRLFRDTSVIDFGGGAGAESDGTDGLSAFKQGFANTERVNSLCGRVLDRDAYERLARERGVPLEATFFPAYRAPAPVSPGV